jgi:hypothetical protein
MSWSTHKSALQDFDHFLQMCAPIVREKLCIPADADPGRAAAQIEASVHAKGYHIDNDAIRNSRTASVDVLWRRAARDVDSMKQAVRLATCQRPVLIRHAQHMCSY